EAVRLARAGFLFHLYGARVRPRGRQRSVAATSQDPAANGSRKRTWRRSTSPPCSIGDRTSRGDDRRGLPRISRDLYVRRGPVSEKIQATSGSLVWRPR